MAFELCTPARNSSPIKSGECSIRSDGTARFAFDDLVAAKITDRFIGLTDRENRRVAVRAPQRGEASSTQVVQRGNGGQPLLYLHSQLRKLGIDPADVVGRHDLTRRGKLLVIQLPRS